MRYYKNEQKVLRNLVWKGERRFYQTKAHANIQIWANSTFVAPKEYQLLLSACSDFTSVRIISCINGEALAIGNEGSFGRASLILGIIFLTFLLET